MEYVTLNNGVKMPKLGYGVYQTPPEETERCVLEAIETGYRSIDTAQAYGNEAGVGIAMAKADFRGKSFSSLQRCGSPMRDMKRQRLPLKNP